MLIPSSPLSLIPSFTQIYEHSIHRYVHNLFSYCAWPSQTHTLPNTEKNVKTENIPSSTPEYQIHSQRQHISFCLIWRNKYKKSEVLPSCRRLANIYLVLFFISYSPSNNITFCWCDDNIKWKKLSTPHRLFYGAVYVVPLSYNTFFLLFMFHFLESVFPEFKCALIWNFRLLLFFRISVFFFFSLLHCLPLMIRKIQFFIHILSSCCKQ